MHAGPAGVAFTITVLVGPVACSATEPSDPAGPPSSNDQQAWSQSAACQAPEATSLAYFYATEGAVKRLEGTWRNCQTGALPPGTLGGAAGFQVLSDGSYYPLGFDESGNPLRLTGFLHEGTIALGPSGPVVLFGSNSLYPLDVMLSKDGTTLRTDSIGNQSGPFVMSHDAVTVSPPEPAGAHEGAAGCTTMESEVLGAPTSIDEGNSRILGSWTLCPDANPSSSGTTPAGTQGVEFSPDGTWAFLMANAGGAPAPSADPSTHGTISWVPSQGILGGPTLQLDMTTASGGTYFCIVSTSMRPLKLQLDNVGGLMTFSAN
jgi:hypothetical protein